MQDMRGFAKNNIAGNIKTREKTWKLVTVIVNLKLPARHLKDASP